MNNIEEKIKMLYDFVYSKSFAGNIEEGDIKLDNINMDDIKIRYDSSVESKDDIKTEILTGKFKKIDYIEDLNTLILKKYGNEHSICLYITPYINESDIDSINDMNNNDCLFSYILSKLVLSKKTKHIALPIINIDVEYAQINDIIKPYEDINDSYYKKMEKEEITNIFSIRVKECFFKHITLTEYLKSSDVNIKNLLFQVIHTLAILQNEYSNFRHNMLSPVNIFVYLKKQQNSVDKYSYKGTDYYLTNNNFDIKITNFSASKIPDMYSSSMVVPFMDEENDYFDLHYFLNNILLILDESKLDESTQKFLEKIIPNKYRSNKNSYYLTKNDELFKPKDLLKDDYFKEFTKKVEMEETYSEDNYYTNYHNNKSKHKKPKDKTKSISGSRILQTGGGDSIQNIPGKKHKNNPFITNEQRRIYKQDKGEPERFYKPDTKESKETKEEPPSETRENQDADKYKPNQDNLIMRQDIIKNPYYKPAQIRKQRPQPWDHEYIPPMDDTIQVPKLKVHYPKPEYKKEYKKEYEYEHKPRQEYEHKYKPKYEHNTTDSDDSRTRSQSPPMREYINKVYPEKSYPDNKYKPRDHAPSDNYYKQDRQPNIMDQQVLAEQKVYNLPQTFPPGTMHTHPRYGGPSWVDIQNQMTYPSQFVPDLPNYFPYQKFPLLKPNEIPLQKIYNINLGNPAYHSTSLNTLYQNALPGKQYVYTMINLFERKQLINHLRSIMVNKIDGEDMTLQAGKKSFLEYIKLVDFNPYKIGRNPYAKLPLNFLLYSGAYPVRYNMESNTIEIAKQAMGLNLRIYNMEQGALRFTNASPEITYDNFDVWRDIKFYKYVKEELHDNNICPNFITYMLYKLDKLSKIDYNNLKTIILTHRNSTDINNTVAMNNTINKLLDSNKTLKDLANNSGLGSDLTKQSNISLIAITEAPNSNLIEWASPIYDKSPASNIMVSTGYHAPEIWRSILFQIMYAMIVLQEKQIYIRDFCAENNLFIKDLFNDPNNIGHWIYNINNLNFYVPNYGYLVLIDNRFTDVTMTDTDNKYYKIEAPNLYSINGYDITNIDNLIRESIRKFFTPTIFGNYKEYGFVEPDISILNLMTTINSKLNNDFRLKDVILECFPEFIHNRVGTLLTKVERDSLSLITMPKLSEGNLVVWQSRYDEYMWAIYLGDIGKKKQIIVKENGKVVRMEVFSYSLKEYPDANNLYQTSEKTFRLNKDSLIETYYYK